jgi:hypothetical protein
VGGSSVFGSWCTFEKGDAPVSQRIKESSVKFVAFVPNQIELADNYRPRLVGFPFNILFAGILKNKQTGQQSLVNVCYWPAPDTFRDNAQRKEMHYYPEPSNDYFILVTFDKKSGHWRTEKFKGKNLIQTAFGQDFEETMIHTTMTGLQPEECPCLENMEYGLKSL